MNRAAGGQREEDHGAGRDEEAAAAQERDGVHGEGAAAQPLLHRHPQHHPGRGGPHTGTQRDQGSGSLKIKKHFSE